MRTLNLAFDDAALIMKSLCSPNLEDAFDIFIQDPVSHGPWLREWVLWCEENQVQSLSSVLPLVPADCRLPREASAPPAPKCSTARRIGAFQVGKEFSQARPSYRMNV